MLAYVEDRDGLVYGVVARSDWLELVSDAYAGPLKVEPQDLLHELTEEGVLRVACERVVFGLGMPKESLTKLRSLARAHALLPPLPLDLSRRRRGALA